MEFLIIGCLIPVIVVIASMFMKDSTKKRLAVFADKIVLKMFSPGKEEESLKERYKKVLSNTYNKFLRRKEDKGACINFLFVLKVGWKLFKDDPEIRKHIKFYSEGSEGSRLSSRLRKHGLPKKINLEYLNLKNAGIRKEVEFVAREMGMSYRELARLM